VKIFFFLFFFFFSFTLFKGDRILVAYKEGVYDITTFIEGHPGGTEKIMQAAGGRVDGFWRLYQQHESQAFVLEILESMRVGNLHPDDKLVETKGPDL
jgi:sulfite oxidase